MNVKYNQGQSQNSVPKGDPNQKNKGIQFTPIPMTYVELLPDLLHKELVNICPAKSLQPPYPKGFNANAKCEYHNGAVGHSTEKCQALKVKVQSLPVRDYLLFKSRRRV